MCSVKGAAPCIVDGKPASCFLGYFNRPSVFFAEKISNTVAIAPRFPLPTLPGPGQNLAYYVPSPPVDGPPSLRFCLFLC